ncbi:MAG: hypothetical protein AAB426_08385 [Myxococcota bacterium]
MPSRLLSFAFALVSLVILGGVGLFFAREFRATRDRQALFAELRAYEERDQPCEGLARVQGLWPTLDSETLPGVKQWQRAYAKRVVGEGDESSQRSLLAAHHDGLLDRTLCEQVRLAHDIGEEHPVLTFLRLTREGADPCAESERLVETLATLGAHRPAMLRTLMNDVGRLRCLQPVVSSAIAAHVLEALGESPTLFDDLDVLRIGAFADAWAPVAAAQASCRAELRGTTSKLFTTLGCTPDQKRRLLPVYELAASATPGATDAAEHGKVWLLWRDEDICDVQPTSGDARLLTVSCARLELRSDLQVAARIESLAYGLVRADVIAGVASYDGASARLVGTDREPPIGSWFAYTRDGRLLGTTRQVRLADLAKQLGEKLPEAPLRAACRQAGARYCYDVDWAQIVQSLGDEAMIFLSRPLPVFLVPLDDKDLTATTASDALGRAPNGNATVHAYPLTGGGLLVAEQQTDGVELRWRATPQDPWHAQSLGRAEGGTAPPAARLVAVFDIDRDGQPELLVERASFRLRGGAKQPDDDTLWLARLENGGRRFAPVSKMVIREY